MNLDDLLNEMSEKMRNRDLSDEYLREHNNSTRDEIGIGEYAYGITMIPCEWVYEYLSDYKRVLKENEHKTEKIENQKAILAILNEKQKDLNKLQNTLSSYKGQFRRQEKENKALKQENEHLHREINRRIKLKIENEKIVDTQFIYKQKIKDKIEEFDIAISECEYSDDDDEEYKEAVEKDKLCLLNQKRALQELIEERREK